MIKMRGRGGVILRIYLVSVFCFVLFFTLYAYRYDVLSYFNEHGYVNYDISDKLENEIINDLKAIGGDKENETHIRNYFINKLNDYDFSAYDVDKKDQLRFLFRSNGYDVSMNKNIRDFVYGFDVTFEDKVISFELVPRFINYLEWYRSVSICLSIFLSIIFFLLLSKQSKNHYLKKTYQKITSMKVFKWTTKLSLKIILINILGVVLAFSSFYFMYQNRYSFFEFVRELDTGVNDYQNTVDKIQNKATELTFDKDSEKQLNILLDKYFTGNVDAYLYDEKGVYFTPNLKQRATDADLYIRGSIYDVNAVMIPKIFNYQIVIGDKVGELMIFLNPLTDLVIPYIVFIVLLAFGFYLIILFLFVNKKVKEIELIKEDILVLANGDWNHRVNVLSNDEIAQLAENLNHMRISFLENKIIEEEARKGNKDLIASMSHDLRTPLTSLLGYLDIIRLKKYKSQEQYESYLSLCVDKVNQINELSNKTFEYALVFEASEDFTTEKIALQEIELYLEDNIKFLKLEGFNIDFKMNHNESNINVNMAMIKRIINNLLSNLSKYADCNKKTIITMGVEKEQLTLSFSNEKIVNRDIVESNRIGLKSVTRMVELHQGVIYINDDEDSFMVVINIPMVQS